MEEYIGNICPFCKTEIKEGDTVKVCPECGIPHHKACWEKNKGCTTFGCAQQHYEEEHTNPAAFCVKCGAPLEDGQNFCPKCGTPKGGEKKCVCKKCGAELQEGQEFCTNCGQKAERKNNIGISKEKSKKMKTPLLIGIIAAVIVIAVILIVVFGGGKKDFNERYGNLANNSWCSIASDGSYMKIDTNPKDKDSDDFTWSDLELSLDALEAIETINKELGFSDALLEKMNSTTWSQGKQTESNDKYTASWTYHPDKGLEIMYEFNK